MKSTLFTWWLSHCWRNLSTGLLLMLAAWILYLPSIRYGFVYYDDVRILRDHPELYGQATLAEDFHAIFQTAFPREEPLLIRDASWAIDSRIFGFSNAAGYHLTNVLLHGAVVAMLFAFLIGATRRYEFALAVSVAFLVVGVHTEPVVWIMGRKDILSGLFMLLALCAQNRRLTAKGFWPQAIWYLLASGSFALGLFSKISVLTFPAVLWLHAVLFPYLNGERAANAKFVWNRNLLKESLLTLPLLAFSLLVYGWYRRTLEQMNLFDFQATGTGWRHCWQLLMVDPYALLAYAKEVFLPWQLSLFHAWPKIATDYSASHAVGCLAATAFFIAFGSWLFCTRKNLFFYYAAFFIAMAPYLNLVVPGILVADRYVYFTVFCLLAVAAGLLIPILRKTETFPRILAAVLAVTFLVWNLIQTLSYQPAWRNAETLWQYHLSLPQPSQVAYENLAAYYYAQACERPGTPEMNILMQKMDVVVKAGLDRFWPDKQTAPPPETAYLFFLQSIDQEVTGDLDAALANLLMADRLRPHFDAINLNLALLYHKLAEKTPPGALREKYARAACDRYQNYVSLVYSRRAVPESVQKKLADLEANTRESVP